MEKPTIQTIRQIYSDFPTTNIYLTIFGSHLWGTAVATSDYDIRGVCLEPPRALIGLGGFAQYERLEPIDITIWGLRKFTELAIGNNPNILCVLFSPITHPNNPAGTTLYHSWAWKYIHDLRHSFLVKDKIVDNFIGYAYGQYIKANKHVQWLKNPPKLPDSYKYGYVDNHGWEFANHKQKVEFDAKKKEYENYTKWVENRNQKRHETELLYGIDCKMLYNMVMLLELGIELLRTGEMEFPRPNKDLLLDIRNGGMNYEQAGIYLDQQKAILEKLRETSKIPNKPNTKIIEKLVMELLYTHLYEERGPNYDKRTIW